GFVNHRDGTYESNSGSPANTLLSPEGRLPTTPAPEPVQEEWGSNATAFARDRSVQDFFREQARLRPAAPAVSDDTRELDYGTLDRLSNRVTNRLFRAGLQPESIVALVIDRSCAF